jgi:hippurate hydrolase
MPSLGGKPGCFFFLGGHEERLGSLSALPPASSSSSHDEQDQIPGAFATAAANALRRQALRTNCICHGTAFDFNDNLLPPAALVWVRLVEARLGVALYGADDLSPGLVAAAVEKAAAAGAAAWAHDDDAAAGTDAAGALKKRKFVV